MLHLHTEDLWEQRSSPAAQPDTLSCCYICKFCFLLGSRRKSLWQTEQTRPSSVIREQNLESSQAAGHACSHALSRAAVPCNLH